MDSAHLITITDVNSAQDLHNNNKSKVINMCMYKMGGCFLPPDLFTGQKFGRNYISLQKKEFLVNEFPQCTCPVLLSVMS